MAARHGPSGRRRDVRLLDRPRGRRTRARKVRSVAGSRRISATTRGWSISRPSAARSSKSICGATDQWPDLYGRGMGRRARPSLFARRMDIRRSRPSRRLQRRAVRPARRALAASFAAADRRHPVACRRVERPDHVPRGSRSAVARDASRRLPPRDRELLEPRGRSGRAQSAPHVFHQRRASSRNAVDDGQTDRAPALSSAPVRTPDRGQTPHRDLEPRAPRSRVP